MNPIELCFDLNSPLEWATISVRTLALQYLDRPISVPGAQRIEAAAWDAYLACRTPRTRAPARRKLIHARARLYAALLAATPNPHEHAVSLPPIIPAADLDAGIAKHNEQARIYHARRKYSRLQAELPKLLAACTSLKLELQEARTAVEKAFAVVQVVNSRHERALAARRLTTENYDARLPRGQLAVVREARAALAHARQRRDQVQAQYRAMQTRVSRTQTWLDEARSNERT